MAKEGVLKFKGVVSEVLPSTVFRVILSENNHVVTCTLSGRMRTNNIKILLHDEVEIEMTPYDMGKGRIIYRF